MLGQRLFGNFEEKQWNFTLSGVTFRRRIQNSESGFLSMLKSLFGRLEEYTLKS